MLSYGSILCQRFVAVKVASSVAVAVRYGNVGGIFSGNEALVASLMAECDGMHTISFGHAMCHLLFPLTRRVFSPCHIFCQGFATCVAIAFARNASLPFRCTCVAKGFCSQPKFCHSICCLCFCPRQVFASVFCHRCCHYICPRRFFPSMLPCRLPPPLP